MQSQGRREWDGRRQAGKAGAGLRAAKASPTNSNGRSCRQVVINLLPC